MAGQFLQLLASLERQKKAEVDADMKLTLATNLETRREEARAHETALARKHQANMYLLNSALQDQRALEKEVKVLETGLEGLGISIQEQSQLKAEDQTDDARGILDLVYEDNIAKLDFNQLASASVGEKISAVTGQNEDLEERIAVLNQHKREYDAVDNSLKEMSKQFYESEMAQGVMGDWVVDEREMAGFIGINEEDYNATVQQFGGNEAEVQRRLRSHFGQYTKEQMQVLNDVYAVQANRANVIKRQQEIGLLPPAAQVTAKAMQKQLDANVKEFNGVVTQMGSDFTAKQIEDNPVLEFFQGDTIPDRSGLAGSKQYMSKLEQRMTSAIRELDKYEIGLQDIDSGFRNDYESLALWYSGQIVEMDKFVKDNPEYKSSKADFVRKDGEKFMFVPHEDSQLKYAAERIDELDLDGGTILGIEIPLANPEVVINGAISFFREYSKAKELYSGINDQKGLLLNSIGVNADPVSGGRNVGARTDRLGNEIVDNVNNQEEVDELIAMQQFNDEFNMEYGAIYKNARDAGYGNDVIGYMNEYRGKAMRPSFNWTDEQARTAYYETGMEGDGTPASERAVEIIARLEQIERDKKDEFSEWLEAEGDDQLQYYRKGYFDSYSYMGEGWETLHEEGADLVDELKEIRDVAAKIGDSGLWDYYIYGSGREPLMIGLDEAPQIRFSEGIGSRFKHRSQFDRIEELR